LISDEIVHLANFPTRLVDVRYKAEFIESIGGVVKFDSDEQSCSINAEQLKSELATSYSIPIRTTYLLAAGLLKRFGIARIPYPGGCNIGNRAYDLHIMLWEKMGCDVEEKRDYIEIKSRKLHTFDISFPISTIGGTENALICASMLPGRSTIRNAYISPEVADLIQFLQAIGADIRVTGNSFVEIVGKATLRGTTFTVVPDRIEALTWIIFAAIAGGDVLVENVPFDHMQIPLIHLKEAGVDVFRNTKDAYINPNCFINKTIQPFELACGTHPGVISDMQPFFVLLALKANGISRVYDYRYPERTAYLNELSKFCPDALSWEPGKITIRGPVEFKGADVTSTDLRGSMALLLAALLAGGQSTIQKVHMALRGYNNLIEKLAQLGIKI
jgi:UDP-N-acetylglucosamine 1-carboxyvinyltransferase